MRLIRFTYRGVERVALEVEADSRMINCMHCIQAEKGGEPDIGPRSFKVPEMRDVQGVTDQGEIQTYLMERPEFLAAVRDELSKRNEDRPREDKELLSDA